MANARASETAALTDGGLTQDVRLVELEPDQAAPVLRWFGEQVPAGLAFLKRSGLVTNGTADELEALAGTCPVFRIDPIT